MFFSPTNHRLITASQLGQLLTSTRKRQKMTQAAVGIRVGLSQNRISHLESHADECGGQVISYTTIGSKVRSKLPGVFGKSG